MIFVTVGNHSASFTRLLSKVDELAQNKIIDNVFAQIGYADYEPKFYEYREFIGFYEFQNLIKQSDLVITHAGAGTTISIISQCKPAIVVPRLKRFGEHTNDHQLQITRTLEKRGEIIAVYEIGNLKFAIETAKNFIPKTKKENSDIMEFIESYLAKYDLTV